MTKHPIPARPGPFPGSPAEGKAARRPRLVRPAVLIFGTLLAVPFIAGCGGRDNLPREAVSGAVLLDGKPLETGIITFVPSDPDVPTQGGTTIVEGAYAIPRNQGLVPGTYKVIISSGEGSQEKPVEDLDELGPGMPPIPAEEAIPAQYSGNTVLEATVTAGGRNEFEFTLNKGGVGG